MAPNPTFVRILGGAALLAGLMAAGMIVAARRSSVDCCTDAELQRAAGPVETALFESKPSSRSGGLAGSKWLKIKIRGIEPWVVYDAGWPHFEAVRAAILPETEITLDYGNCRTAFSVTHCDAFRIATAAGGVLTTPGEVRAVKADKRALLINLAAALAAVAACLGGLVLYWRRRGRSAADL